MGIKIWCLGTTLVIGSYLLGFKNAHGCEIAGAILMLVGNILMFIEK